MSTRPLYPTIEQTIGRTPLARLQRIGADINGRRNNVILAGLSREADRALRAAGYSGVLLRVGDGWAGWPEQAPFDAIVVTAAPETLPPPLVDQLRVGGRMVIPLGPQGAAQELVVAEKQADGSMARRRVLPVAFVPFTGEGARR